LSFSQENWRIICSQDDSEMTLQGSKYCFRKFFYCHIASTELILEDFFEKATKPWCILLWMYLYTLGMIFYFICVTNLNRKIVSTSKLENKIFPISASLGMQMKFSIIFHQF
jgi:hypothetical protein